ncbi:MAG TPA: T9SS type A sorting domain-containing protein [Prolixibacteraceae bacterium]|nr:T9SS type A sorting domain-containing protein [Prolixibacteraceae bacterium]
MKPINICLLLLFGVMFINQSFTQKITHENEILVYDFVPDSQFVSVPDSLKLDINQDQIPDIALYIAQPSFGHHCRILSINEHCEYAFIHSEYCKDTLTCDSIRWHTKDLMWSDYDSGKIVGVRFTINNNYYYGWIMGYQVYSTTFSFYIDKYAFCNIPNYPLLLGQTYLTGIEESGIKKLARVFVNQSEKQITVEAVKKIKQVQLLNINGTTITALTKVNSTSATFHTDGLPGGAYLVQVTLNNGNVQTVKVLLE